MVIVACLTLVKSFQGSSGNREEILNLESESRSSLDQANGPKQTSKIFLKDPGG